MCKTKTAFHTESNVHTQLPHQYLYTQPDTHIYVKSHRKRKSCKYIFCMHFYRHISIYNNTDTNANMFTPT